MPSPDYQEGKGGNMSEETKEMDGLGLEEFLDEATEIPEEETSIEEEVSEEETSEEEETSSQEEEEVSTEEKETSPEEKEEGKDEKPSPQEEDIWEREENPYKKRFRDTAAWANRVHQETLDLKKQIEMINKKLDGTYDYEAEEEQEVPPEAIQAQAKIEGKIEASNLAAIKEYGEEYVNKMIWAEDAPFRELYADPVIAMEVDTSPAPVLKAIEILQREEFHKKYGKDPQTIRQKITEEIEKELSDKITKKILEKFNLKENQVKGLGNIRGSEVLEEEEKIEIDDGTLIDEVFS